ncbi:hypothetical protein B0A48_05946 [Cryoendolithus antarcticus]|uniref:Methyltransferase domain-containing protein n=1 Tax=Cryoendolithus antarcticus TaxID=1507870 RepID=A0A1V8TCG1_9PEZI|nr:hypothetical protein B0A48_05946 [Cryoendolithus antarcticus]
MSTTAEPGYAPGYTTTTHHEFRTAHNSAAYLLLTLEELCATTTNPTLLDVGCGSGTITASFATLFPNLHITALDLSPEILTRAKAHADKLGVSDRITFKSANVYDLVASLGDDTKFDVVHAHQMLVHLSDPVKAMQQLLSVAKFGGWLACRDICMRTFTFYPDTEILQSWTRLQLATHNASGGSSNAGASLGAWAVQAGASRKKVKLGMGSWMYASPEERKVWGGTFRDRIISGSMRTTALELGIASEAEMDEMAKEWERWMANEDACSGSLHGELLVQK